MIFLIKKSIKTKPYFLLNYLFKNCIYNIFVLFKKFNEIKYLFKILYNKK